MIFNWKGSTKQIDFLAIGDTVVDAFIRLEEAHINCGKDEGHCELCMAYAEKLPYTSVDVIPAVGNSANASVSAARLGLNSALVTNIGNDDDGKLCLARLKEEKVDVSHIKIHNDHKTNYHYVLWFDKDRTILVKHETYNYSLPKMENPKWLYLSSLGNHTESYHEEIAQYLENNPTVNFVFQPGTFQMKLGVEILSRIYKHTNIFFCNVEEAQRILNTENSNVKELLAGIRSLGPKIAVITDGPRGSYSDDGVKAVFLEAYPDQKPAFERTGAGDAFASTFTSALILGKSPEEAMKWGSINAMSVVQEVGAQKGLLTEKDIMRFMKDAPIGWNAKEI